ncbi:MAG: hypothetical protein AAGC57_04915 [Pseudomonadota bacterium]
MIRGAAVLGAAVLLAILASAPLAATPPAGKAVVSCGSREGQTVTLLYRVRFLDRSAGWAVRDSAGGRTVLRETCLERQTGALARHRCGPARGVRVAVLRYAGVLANQVDPHPFSLTSLYEVAFLAEDGTPLETPETELVFRSCLALDQGERWPEPRVTR